MMPYNSVSEAATKVSVKKATAMLKRGKSVHTFTNPCVNLLLGADWPRSDIIAAFKKHGVELSGAQATAMHHGLVFYDGKRHVFVETA